MFDEIGLDVQDSPAVPNRYNSFCTFSCGTFSVAETYVVFSGAGGTLPHNPTEDAWGRVLGVYDGSGNPLTESAIGNRHLWQGREYSWNTGLYYFRARWYDPCRGRRESSLFRR